MVNVILSRYFDGNTKMVANFCKRCYLQEEEVVITSVNIRFLEINDPKYYQVFSNNFFFISRSKSDLPSSNFDEFIQQKKTTMPTQNLASPEHKTLMKIKRRKNSKEKETDTNEIKKEPKQNSFTSHDGKKWIPPISPHNLVEEKYYNDPWALLVVTIFLNKTSCVLALPFMEKFFEDFKGPYDVLKVEVDALEPYFVKLGLVKTRATQVWRMSHDFVNKDWVGVGELYGVGKYAEDAYRMFHLGDFSVEPSDRYLKIYKAWYEMRKRNEEVGVRESNSQVYLEDYYVVPEEEDRTGDLD